MNAQQEAVALYKFLESRGFKPSVRSIGCSLRLQGLSFTEANLRSWLKSFVASPTRADAVPTHETSTNDAVPTQPDAKPTRLRAHNKVSLPSNIAPSEPGTVVELFPDAPKPPPKPDRRSPAEQEADLTLSRLRPVIEPELVGMTWTAWRSRNRQVLVDMTRAGMTAAEIVGAHAEHSERKGRTTMVMRYVQDDLLTASARGAPVYPGHEPPAPYFGHLDEMEQNARATT